MLDIQRTITLWDILKHQYNNTDVMTASQEQRARKYYVLGEKALVWISWPELSFLFNIACKNVSEIQGVSDTVDCLVDARGLGLLGQRFQ